MIMRIVCTMCRFLHSTHCALVYSKTYGFQTFLIRFAASRAEILYYIDLLFYHLTLRRYIVLEIKVREFNPGDGAQLGMYMTAVDKLLKHPDDKPALGLLLVREKNKVLVEYALKGTNHPISVAEWETKLTKSLPENLRSSLPTVEELEVELENNPK